MHDTFAFLIFAAPLGLILVIAAFFLPWQRGRLIVTGIVLMMVGILAFGMMPLFDAHFWRLNIIQ